MPTVIQQPVVDGQRKVVRGSKPEEVYSLPYPTRGALHGLNQMVNPRVNHLVKCRRVARDPNPRLKLT